MNKLIFDGSSIEKRLLTAAHVSDDKKIMIISGGEWITETVDLNTITTLPKAEKSKLGIVLGEDFSLNTLTN